MRPALALALVLAWSGCGADGDDRRDGPAAADGPSGDHPSIDASMAADAAEGPVTTGDGPPGEAGGEGPAQAGDAPGATDGPAGGADGPFANLRWAALQVPIGGAMRALAFDGAGRLYAGGVGVGIYVSPDEGASWRPISVGLTSYELQELAADGNVVFAGTTSLLRSEDGGATWLAPGPRSTVGQVKPIAAQGDLVVAGSTYGGDALWVSNDRGKTFQSSRFAVEVTDVAVLGSVVLRAGPHGVQRSTDRGATFVGVPGVTDGDASLRCDGVKTCYAAAHTAGTFEPAVILKTTDAGATWMPTGKQSPKVLAVSETGIVYVTTNATVGRSDDGGQTWVEVFRPTTRESFAPDCNGGFVARGDKLFAACQDGVYRSDDRGARWNWAGGSPSVGAIVGRVSFAVADTSATALGPDGDLYASGFGSKRSHLFRSVDDGRTWTDVTSPFDGGGCIVTAKGALMCIRPSATKGPLIRSEDHGTTWRDIAVDAPGTTQSDGVNPGILARHGSIVYAAGRGVARSEDDGLTFQLTADREAVTDLQVLRNGHLLAKRFLRDVYRSDDRGTTWKKLSVPIALPVMEADAGRIVAYAGGQLIGSNDEGDTWAPLPFSTGAPFASGNPPALPAMDGLGRFYLLLNRQLHVSADGGASWTLLPAPLPNTEVIRFFSDRKGRLLAATQGGLYRLD
jgi:photosystem II stability/assembly factor-like uncharacterized protein